VKTRWLGAALLLAQPALAARAGGLDPGERRGREIFRHGTSGGGRRVSVTLNGEPVPVTFGCAGCHGRDGRGRSEGGTRPPDIRWESLVRPAAGGARHPRPAYDRATLVRAITMGIDPGGRPLDPVMPRYQLMREDADDLLAYLGRLGVLSDPGLTADDFHLGVFLPPGPGRNAARRAVEEWEAGLRARGGIYGRRPAVLYLEDGPAGLEGLAEEAEPLAVVGDPGDASLDRTLAWVRAREVPWLRTAPPGAGRGPQALLNEVRALERALARAGRDVSRERLAEVLRKD
jgi:mono/diheme cytochrome c family protein